MGTNDDENEQIIQRRNKLAELRQNGNAFPNDFRRNSLAARLHAEYAEKDSGEIELRNVRVKVAGRMMTQRIMGKASFVHVQDMSGQIQIYVQRDGLTEGGYEDFKKWDLGDVIGAEGTLFKTKTGELSVRASDIRLLTKSLRPLPEKYHGLTDQEARYRRRYLDLIANEATRRVFQTRTRVIDYLRRYLNDQGYLEVETPMMQPIPGGAAARPFVTHHNVLDMKLYLRVAPELYLKRLVVGGFERVYEINRSFRNEGLSTRHNPEFTMLEFYQAFADYRDLMRLTEEMLRGLAREVLGSTSISYQGEQFDFDKPFKRLTLKQAIIEFNPDIAPADLKSPATLRQIATRCDASIKKTDGAGALQLAIFEKTVESQLKDPTYITEYPTDVSPLARRSEQDPDVTDRFELIVGGREIANGFSELNDAEDQAERFKIQARAKEEGNQESMYYDEDYIRALEYGLPPTAGEGIGIDRLVMLLTDSPSIRDVILFPQMRPE
jgi:lysyl-tRNA synthetase class 2